jgi:hypothetical protein
MGKNEKTARCLDSGARETISVADQLSRSTRCSRCGRVLRVRVRASESGDENQVTLPHHNRATAEGN